MSLWICREGSNTALLTTLKPLASLLEGAFLRVDEALEYFQKFLFAEPASDGRVCAVTVIKGRNLALGCYSLALDGLAQESGALLRPLLEVIESLVYLRTVPGAIDKAIDEKLPTAGKVAEATGSPFKDLREHLNKYASHLGFGAASLGHLLDIPSGRLRTVQPFNESVLERNIATIFAFTVILAREAALCFRWCAGEIAPSSAESLVTKAQLCLDHGEQIIKPILAKRRAAE